MLEDFKVGIDKSYMKDFCDIYDLKNLITEVSVTKKPRISNLH